MAPDWTRVFLACVLSLAGTAALSQQTQPDTDVDGVSDSREQALLEKFRPTFLISSTDCAVRPARFAPDTNKPRLLARDGTIYGQVFRLPVSGAIEIHYYMLWDRDCGRGSHALDAEHVSVLLAPDSAELPAEQGAYWYAAAHEHTVCDASNGARAATIQAVDRGPRVWISSGKHASFLSKELCRRGCGGDECNDNVELAPAEPVINIGERILPMNGALWIASSHWPLAQKMDTDFSSATLALLNATASDAPIGVAPGKRTARAAILGGDSSLDGIANGARHTEGALDVADAKTSKSMDKAAGATGRSLKRALKATVSWMKPKKTKKPAE